MKTLPYCILLCALFTGSMFGQHRDDRRPSWSRDGERVAFDNRSDTEVTVYRRTGLGKFKTFGCLAPGEGIVTPVEAGQIWTVGTPTWYRVIDTIKVGDSRLFGGNRVVITNAKVNAIGRSQKRMNLSNRTGKRIALYQKIGSEELDWARLEVGRSQFYYAYQGQEWVARDTATGAVLDRFTVGSNPGTILIKNRARGGGGGGVVWGGRDAEPVSMTITNRGSRSVAVLKRTTLGSRTVGTIAGRQTGRIDTEPGDVWRIEDTETFAVLETVNVPSGRRTLSVEVGRPGRHGDHRRPVPTTPLEVTLRIYNDTGEAIDVMRRRDGTWKHAKRINKNRFWDIEFEAGQRVSIRDPHSGRVLEEFRAPQGDRVVRVKGHGDHAHVGTERDTPAPRATDRREDDVIGRGAILRRIFGE